MIEIKSNKIVPEKGSAYPRIWCLNFRHPSESVRKTSLCVSSASVVNISGNFTTEILSSTESIQRDYLFRKAFQGYLIILRGILIRTCRATITQ
jgi:hypothetical protein